MSFETFYGCLAALLLGSSSLWADTIAVNFAHSSFFGTTGIQQPIENTNSLDIVASLENPVWTNHAIEGAGAGASGDLIVAGLQITIHASGAHQSGNEMVTLTGDASQQVFRMYLEGEDVGSYEEGDGYGVSVEVRGLSALLTKENANSYKLSLFLSTDGKGFGVPELREGHLTGQNRIADLPLLGTFQVPERLGDGAYPCSMLVATNMDTGVRTVAVLSDLMADRVVIALPKKSGAKRRGSLAGIAITTQRDEALPMEGLEGPN